VIKVVQPLFNLMRNTLLDNTLLHIDETVVQVLKEKDRKPTSQSYMWVQTGGPPDKPVVIYDYDPSRSGEVPMRLLHVYQGYLMADGYAGYVVPKFMLREQHRAWNAPRLHLYAAHNKWRFYSPFRNVISDGSFVDWRGVGGTPEISTLANAFAFISMSTSA